MLTEVGGGYQKCAIYNGTDKKKIFNVSGGTIKLNASVILYNDQNRENDGPNNIFVDKNELFNVYLLNNQIWINIPNNDPMNSDNRFYLCFNGKLYLSDIADNRITWSIEK